MVVADVEIEGQKFEQMGIMIKRDSEQSLQCILGTNVLDRMKGQQSETGISS